MGWTDIFRAAPPRARIEPRLPGAAAAPGRAASGNAVQSPGQWSTLTAGGRASRAGVTVSEGTALTLPALLQALRVLTGVFAMTPMHVYRRDGEARQRADDTALWELLHDRPNSHQSAFAFKELLLGDLTLQGNFFAYVSRDRRQNPVALTRLKPGHTQVAEFFSREQGQVLFFDATLPDGSRERFPARDIWHVAGPTRNGIAGLNPLVFMRDALGGALAAQDYATRFWANDARPPVQLRTDAKMSAADKQRLRADWRNLFAGVDGDTIAVLDQGLEAKFLSFNPEEAQLLQTRTYGLLDVARIVGVPPHLVFELSRATFGNIEHQSLEFVIFHMGPHYARVAASATCQFCGPGEYVEFVTDALVKGDIKTRWEAYNAARNAGVLNANEIRTRENLNPMPGAAGTEYWRPANMMLAGTPVQPPTPQRIAPATP